MISTAVQYFGTVNNIRKHTWATPYEIVNRSDKSDLLKFKKDSYKPTVVIVPPQAGHISSGVDLAKGRSLVETFANDDRFGGVYAFDFHDCTYSQRNDTIGDTIDDMYAAIETLHRKVILVGICAGGWQAAVFAALHPSKVEKLVTVAAPIDYEAEGGLNAFYQNLPIEFFQGMVDMGGGIMDGQLIVSGYKSMHFIDRYIKDGCDLYWKIKNGNDDGVQKQIDFIAWYDKGTSKMPGKYYMEVIDMFKHNKLVKGQMIVNRQAVNLTDIRCPVIVVTGSEDDVTGEGQAVGLKGFVKDFTHYEIPGVGHFGSFSGAGSMKHWKERIFEGVANA